MNMRKPQLMRRAQPVKERNYEPLMEYPEPVKERNYEPLQEFDVDRKMKDFQEVKRIPKHWPITGFRQAFTAGGSRNSSGGK